MLHQLKQCSDTFAALFRLKNTKWEQIIDGWASVQTNLCDFFHVFRIFPFLDSVISRLFPRRTHFAIKFTISFSRHISYFGFGFVDFSGISRRKNTTKSTTTTSLFSLSFLFPPDWFIVYAQVYISIEVENWIRRSGVLTFDLLMHEREKEEQKHNKNEEEIR